MNDVKLEVKELVQQGKALYSVNEFNEAISYFNKAIELDQYYEEAHENLGVCYIMMDKYDEAKKVFNRCLLINKQSSISYFHLGNISLLEGNSQEAKAMYSKAELLGYNSSVMCINLATFYEEQGEYEKSLEQYSKLLRNNPYSYDLMDRKTQLLIRINKIELALESAKKMVQTDVDRFEGYHYIYICLIMMKRYDEAKDYIDEVIERFPGNETALFDQVRLYDLIGLSDEALQKIDEYFPMCDELPHVAVLKLGLLLQKKRVDDAINLVKSSDDLKKDPDVLTIMYSVHFAKKDFEIAYSYCKMIQNLGEASSQYYASWYFMALAEKYMGKGEIANEHFKKAAEDYKHICHQNPAHIDLYMYRALCEYQIGNIFESKKCIEFLLAIQPNFAAFHHVAAIIYDASGEKHTADKHRAIAKDLDPNMEIPLT